MKIALWGIILFLFMSCNDKSVDTNKKEIKQKVFYQYEYINYAWGYNHSGWFVDSTGEVFCFNKPENWLDFDSTGTIKAEDLDRNLFNINAKCYTIDKTELAAKKNLIDSAVVGFITKPEMVMADAGTSSYYCLVYDSKTNTYKRTLLNQWGDYQMTNTAPAAKELFEWLSRINDKIAK
jgi:hypothetical protein